MSVNETCVLVDPVCAEDTYCAFLQLDEVPAPELDACTTNPEYAVCAPDAFEQTASVLRDVADFAETYLTTN